MWKDVNCFWERRLILRAEKMSKTFGSLAFVPLLCTALLLLSQGVTEAGFVYGENDSCHDVIGAGASETAPATADSDDPVDSETPRIASLDAAVTPQSGVSVPGGMSPNSTGSRGSSGPSGSVVSPPELTGIEFSAWLCTEGRPRLPPAFSTTILDPPRAMPRLGVTFA